MVLAGMAKKVKSIVISEEKEMSDEKKSIKSEEVCEGNKKLSLEELEKLSGGGNARFNIEDWNGYAEPENTK